VNSDLLFAFFLMLSFTTRQW